MEVPLYYKNHKLDYWLFRISQKPNLRIIIVLLYIVLKKIRTKLLRIEHIIFDIALGNHTCNLQISHKSASR